MVAGHAPDPGGAPRTMAALKALVLKKQEAWISRVLYRKFSVPITYVLLRTPATPNQVTWASAIIGLAALLGIGNPWSDPVLVLAGLLLFQLAIVLDHVDGEVARAKRMPSPGGWYLDNFVMEILLHLGLCIALPLAVYFETQDTRWLLAGAAFASLKALGLANFMLKAVVHLRNPQQAKTAAKRDRRPGPLTRIGERYWEVKKMANASFVFLLVDLGLAAAGQAPRDLGGIPFTVTGAFVVVGIVLLAGSLLLDVWGASRGRFYVDLDPYK